MKKHDTAKLVKNILFWKNFSFGLDGRAIKTLHRLIKLIERVGTIKVTYRLAKLPVIYKQYNGGLFFFIWDQVRQAISKRREANATTARSLQIVPLFLPSLSKFVKI